MTISMRVAWHILLVVWELPVRALLGTCDVGDKFQFICC